MIPETMYRVTYRSSEDGRGFPTHITYTEDLEAVQRFWNKHNKNPYVTVQVFCIMNGKEEGYQKLDLD